jgi:hypothetical protein
MLNVAIFTDQDSSRKRHLQQRKFGVEHDDTKAFVYRRLGRTTRGTPCDSSLMIVCLRDTCPIYVHPLFSQGPATTEAAMQLYVFDCIRAVNNKLVQAQIAADNVGYQADVRLTFCKILHTRC